MWRGSHIHPENYVFHVDSLNIKSILLKKIHWKISQFLSNYWKNLFVFVLINDIIQKIVNIIHNFWDVILWFIFSALSLCLFPLVYSFLSFWHLDFFEISPTEPTSLFIVRLSYGKGQCCHIRSYANMPKNKGNINSSAVAMIKSSQQYCRNFAGRYIVGTEFCWTSDISIVSVFTITIRMSFIWFSLSLQQSLLLPTLVGRSQWECGLQCVFLEGELMCLDDDKFMEICLISVFHLFSWFPLFAQSSCPFFCWIQKKKTRFSRSSFHWLGNIFRIKTIIVLKCGHLQHPILNNLVSTCNETRRSSNECGGSGGTQIE